MYLFINIGGTNIRTTTSLDGKNLGEIEKYPTPQNFDEAIQLFRIKLNLQVQPLKKVICGVAGILNKEKSKLFYSPNLLGWNNKPLKEELEFLFKCPVELFNDASLEALGEACFGVGKEKDIIAYIVIGTGLGGARVVNKRLDASVFGQEPGHQILEFEENNYSRINSMPYFENLVSGSAIEKFFNKKAQDLDSKEVWEKIAKRLAIGLHNSIVHWSPQLIILGGSISQKIPIEVVKKVLDKTLKFYPQLPEIKHSSLAEQARFYE